MTTMTPDSLLQFMRKNKYQADIQQDTQQVYIYIIQNQSEGIPPLF